MGFFQSVVSKKAKVKISFPKRKLKIPSEGKIVQKMYIMLG